MDFAKVPEGAQVRFLGEVPPIRFHSFRSPAETSHREEDCQPSCPLWEKAVLHTAELAALEAALDKARIFRNGFTFLKVPGHKEGVTFRVPEITHEIDRRRGIEGLDDQAP